MMLPPDTDDMDCIWGTRPTEQMPRQAGPKTRSSLRTTSPHQNHKESQTEAVIALSAYPGGEAAGDVFTVRLSLIASTGSPPMGQIIQPLRLGQNGDLVARVAEQVYPRWRRHERPFAAEGAMVTRLGCGGFGLLIHAGQVSTCRPCWQQPPEKGSVPKVW
jgi:hypothetical protein